jgi:hypothetical protein
MSEAKARTEVHIQINRENVVSPAETKGRALYRLGEIPEGQELFMELEDEAEDRFIPDDATALTLAGGEHFYSQKTFEIIVNGEQYFIIQKREDFDEVVKLAFPTPPPGSAILYTVAYRKGPRVNPKGTMVAGQSVKLKDGMIFDVTATDKS